MTDARLVLPLSPRRAGLVAFGITVGLWSALVAGAVIPLSPAPRIATAALVGVVVAGALRGRPRDAERLYRLWGRASRLYARILRRVLLVVCHAVITVAGLAGTSLMLERPAGGRSLWHARETLSTDAYASQFDRPGPAWAGRPWRGVAGWAIQSRNGWLIFLVPFLILLSTLDTEQQDRYPAGIYTLF